MQTQPLRSIIESRFILLPNLPYIKRDTPIRIEKSMGPARSPTVFVSPSAFSAKVEAHWLTACSLEPANRPGRIAICHQNVANMLGTFTSILGNAKVNIDAIANKSRGDFAYTLIDTDSAIPADVVKALEASDAVIRVRVIK